MQDKTAIDISNDMRNYIEALMKEVILYENPFNDEKKSNLKRFCKEEKVNYDDLKNNIDLLCGVSDEVKKTKSKILETYLEMVAKKCFFSSEVIRELIDGLGNMRNTGGEMGGNKYEEVCLRMKKKEAEKDKSIEDANQISNQREQKETELATEQSDFQKQQQLAESDAGKKYEKDLDDIVKKKNELKLQYDELCIKVEKEVILLRQEMDNNIEDRQYEEKKESVFKMTYIRAIWITCIAIAACVVALLFAYAF